MTNKTRSESLLEALIFLLTKLFDFHVLHRVVFLKNEACQIEISSSVLSLASISRGHSSDLGHTSAANNLFQFSRKRIAHLLKKVINVKIYHCWQFRIRKIKHFLNISTLTFTRQKTPKINAAA